MPSDLNPSVYTAMQGLWHTNVPFACVGSDEWAGVCQLTLSDTDPIARCGMTA